jgi:aspartate/glutamate racemase
MRTVGLLGGMNFEVFATYYRLINEGGICQQFEIVKNTADCPRWQSPSHVVEPFMLPAR